MQVGPVTDPEVGQTPKGKAPLPWVEGPGVMLPRGNAVFRCPSPFKAGPAHPARATCRGYCH